MESSEIYNDKGFRDFSAQWIKFDQYFEDIYSLFKLRDRRKYILDILRERDDGEKGGNKEKENEEVLPIYDYYEKFFKKFGEESGLEELVNHAMAIINRHFDSEEEINHFMQLLPLLAPPSNYLFNKGAEDMVILYKKNFLGFTTRLLNGCFHYYIDLASMVREGYSFSILPHIKDYPDLFLNIREFIMDIEEGVYDIPDDVDLEMGSIFMDYQYSYLGERPDEMFHFLTDLFITYNEDPYFVKMLYNDPFYDFSFNIIYKRQDLKPFLLPLINVFSIGLDEEDIFFMTRNNRDLYFFTNKNKEDIFFHEGDFQYGIVVRTFIHDDYSRELVKTFFLNVVNSKSLIDLFSFKDNKEPFRISIERLEDD